MHATSPPDCIRDFILPNKHAFKVVEPVRGLVSLSATRGSNSNLWLQECIAPFITPQCTQRRREVSDQPALCRRFSRSASGPRVRLPLAGPRPTPYCSHRACRTQPTQTEVLLVFPQTLYAYSGKVSNLSRDRFLPHPFQFIILCLPIIDAA
jgi:hypothetical protein